MKVKISVESDISYEFKTNVIKENTKHKKDITRLAIKTKRKINKGTIKYTIQLY